MTAFCLLSFAFIFFVACPSLSASDPEPGMVQGGGWAATYGGIRRDWAHSIQQASDGGYIVAGETDSFGAGKYDIWVLKLRPDGAVEWQKTYGGDNVDWANSIQQTVDGGYVVAGGTASFGAGKKDIWVLKLTPDGSFGYAQDKSIDPSCNFIRDTSISGKDSSATVKVPSIHSINSDAYPRDSEATVLDTNASVKILCP